MESWLLINTPSQKYGTRLRFEKCKVDDNPVIPAKFNLKTKPSQLLLSAILVLLTVFMLPFTALSESMSAAQQDALQREVIPTYPGSSFTTGDDGEDLTVLWFKSTDSPPKIMAWYQEQLPDWSVLETNGMTVLYQGPPGFEAKQLANTPYIFTRLTTENEPVASEITIRLPKK